MKLNEDRKGIERQILHLDYYKGYININTNINLLSINLNSIQE